MIGCFGGQVGVVEGAVGVGGNDDVQPVLEACFDRGVDAIVCLKSGNDDGVLGFFAQIFQQPGAAEGAVDLLVEDALALLGAETRVDLKAGMAGGEGG